MNNQNNSKAGYVALIGAPNAGKSTLLNRMVGSKIAIVTPKVQTTRQRILGITAHENTQIIFVDTPGIFSASKKFEKAMVKSAMDGARDADIIALMIDSKKGYCENSIQIIKDLKQVHHKKIILILNKVDKVKKEILPSLAEQIFSELNFERCFMISAEKGQGIDDLRDYIAENLPDGIWLYDEDQMTDMPIRMIAAEITREKIFMRLRQELPYSVAVETEKWEEKPDGSIAINQVIYVRSNSQKKILLGKGGEMLKNIGSASRHDLKKMLQTEIHLFLFVKIVSDWKEKKEFYEMSGLEHKAK